MNDKKLWFKAKMYGWGWYPVSWEGWVITFLYTASILVQTFNLDGAVHSGSDFLISFSIPFITNTIFLLIICHARGEKPKWRWGEK